MPGLHVSGLEETVALCLPRVHAVVLATLKNSGEALRLDSKGGLLCGRGTGKAVGYVELDAELEQFGNKAWSMKSDYNKGMSLLVSSALRGLGVGTENVRVELKKLVVYDPRARLEGLNDV